MPGAKETVGFLVAPKASLRHGALGGDIPRVVLHEPWYEERRRGCESRRHGPIVNRLG